jgi:hypothetical protein
MIGRIEETSASFEARSAPRSHPTKAVIARDPAPGSLVLVPSKGTARDLSALQKTVGVRGPMSRSDDYRRFAAECMKIACTADDEQRRAIFVQMARAWFALAQRGATNVDRDEGLEEEIN